MKNAAPPAICIELHSITCDKWRILMQLGQGNFNRQVHIQNIKGVVRV
jgi:hypothetical protein